MDSLAVSYASELARWGIETAIIVPGAFTKGTNHFAHSGSPCRQGPRRRIQCSGLTPACRNRRSERPGGAGAGRRRRRLRCRRDRRGRRHAVRHAALPHPCRSVAGWRRDRQRRRRSRPVRNVPPHRTGRPAEAQVSRFDRHQGFSLAKRFSLERGIESRCLRKQRDLDIEAAPQRLGPPGRFRFEIAAVGAARPDRDATFPWRAS